MEGKTKIQIYIININIYNEFKHGDMYLCIPLSMCTSCPAGDIDMQEDT